MLPNVADLATCCRFCPKCPKNGQLFFLPNFYKKKIMVREYFYKTNDFLPLASKCIFSIIFSVRKKKFSEKN